MNRRGSPRLQKGRRDRTASPFSCAATGPPMLQDIPTPTPTLREACPCVLETERLTLRRPTLADVKAIARLANDRRVAENTRRLPHPYSHDDAVSLVRDRPHDHRDLAFLIENSFVPVGMVGITWR